MYADLARSTYIYFDTLSAYIYFVIETCQLVECCSWDKSEQAPHMSWLEIFFKGVIVDPSISLYIRSNSLFIIYSQHFYQDPSPYARPIIIQLDNYTQNIIPCLPLSFCSVRLAPKCTAFWLVEKLGNAHGFYVIIIALVLHAAMLVYMYNYYTQPCAHDVLHTAHTASAKWNFAGA